MTEHETKIDALLGAALTGEAAWPTVGVAVEPQMVIERALYHGIAAILTDRADALVDWPSAATVRLRQQALAQAMWELRHKQVLAQLLERLAEERIGALLLKGSALAYDLYEVPALRSRGDSDLLIAPVNLARTRTLLANLGYAWHPEVEDMPDEFALQEEWVLTSSDGTRHAIDLHWQLLNAPALAGLLEANDIWSEAIAVPRLGKSARAMSHVHNLVHTCVHRAMHLAAPYVVDGRAYYGAERLIWARDIDLLARSLSEGQWDRLIDLAGAQGISPVILNGLEFAHRVFETPVPAPAQAALAAAAGGRASNYLLRSRQVGRAWSDLRAVPGWRRKAVFARARTLPSAEFVRRKYPAIKHWPLPLLHAWRIGDLFRPRGVPKPPR